MTNSTVLGIFLCFCIGLYSTSKMTIRTCWLGGRECALLGESRNKAKILSDIFGNFIYSLFLTEIDTWTLWKSQARGPGGIIESKACGADLRYLDIDTPGTLSA